MEKLTLFSKSLTKPYRDQGLNHIYELLFCDNLDLYKSQSQSDTYPWNVLLAENPDLGELKSISVDDTLEARQRALACNLLLANGVPAEKKELLGVIVEVALPGGLDVIAAFKEGTARYINHAEKLLVWETQSAKSSELINTLFDNSANVVKQIGPWNKERNPSPVNGMTRLTFLVSDGLYFGEAPFEALHGNPMAGPVIDASIGLMTFLIEQTVGPTNGN